MTADFAGERGIAVIVAVMGMLMMSVLGMALVLASSTETIMALKFRDSAGAVYAADAVAGRAMEELVAAPSAASVLGGATRSSFADGAPAGSRLLSDGSTIDLTQILNLANCEKATSCSDADLTAVTGERPWGPNNPRWRLFAYGKLADILPEGAIRSPFYGLLLVADDPMNADPEILALRAEAFGPRGAHAVVELTLERANARILSWRLVR